MTFKREPRWFRVFTYAVLVVGVLGLVAGVVGLALEVL